MTRIIPNNQKVKTLSAKYGTPVNVCYEQTILENIRKFGEAFRRYPGGFELYYSVKTNPITGILKIFKINGVKAEVCSQSDLESSLRAGYRGENIIYDGLVKTNDDLKTAIKNNIKIINIESIDEAKRLDAIAKKLGKRINVGIRLSFPSARVGLKSLLGISYERFGLNSRNGEAQEAAKIILDSKYLNLKGLHCHTGSNQKDSTRYKIGADEIINFAKELRKENNVIIENINLGGGFGINEITAYKITDLAKNTIINLLGTPLNHANSKMNLSKISNEITDHLTKKLKMNGLGLPKLCLEPGRGLVGNSTHLLCKIIGIKQTDKSRWVIIDAGTNLLPVLTMFSEFHEIKILSKNTQVKTSLAGPLLYSSDILVSNRMLPKGNAGDHVIVADVGAYCSSQSNQFLYPRASTILVEKNGHEKIIQKKETVNDMLSRDIL